MKFEGTMPFFECGCGQVALGGPNGTLVINGALHLECQACKTIYQFDCRLKQLKFKRADLESLTNEES
jgi:hypothetical protein